MLLQLLQELNKEKGESLADFMKFCRDIKSSMELIGYKVINGLLDRLHNLDPILPDQNKFRRSH
jgi:hypothetical protein